MGKLATGDVGADVSASPSTGYVTQKRVVEYYVIQKKGWLPGPWSIRERIYDTSGFGEELSGNEDKVEGGPVSGLSGFMKYFTQRVTGR